MSPAAGLALAWAGMVVAVAWRFRPSPRRTRALVPAPRSWARHVPLRAVTRPRTRRARVVITVLGTAVVASVALPLAPAVLVGAWCGPRLRRRRAARRRADRLAAGLPDVVDLLVLAVDAGLTVPLALVAVSRRASGLLADELRHVVAEVRLGRRLSDALDDLPVRAGEVVRPLVGVLLASERYGAPAAPGLIRLADDVRRQRRHRAEEAARRVPVKLLFPLVLCILPAFALLTVAPLVASAARSLRL